MQPVAVYLTLRNYKFGEKRNIRKAPDVGQIDMFDLLLL